MWIKIFFILFFASIYTGGTAFAQETPLKKDSTHFYESIETYSKRTRFTKFIYRLVFRPVITDSIKKEVSIKQVNTVKQDSYSAFEGKTIRNITIVTLDPFGYSNADTIVRMQNFMSKTGNWLHIKSLNITIRNLLLIKQNQIFDSLLVKESERLIRSMGYVHDVTFFIKPTSKNSDSVDIFIRELDNWTIVPNGAITNSLFTINLTDKNFLGLGHESKNDFTMHYSTEDYAFNTKYYIPNILNTYINTTLQYNTDEYNNSNRCFAIDRQFFSAYAKWAAGYNITQQYSRSSIQLSDSVLILQEFRSNTQDYWAGNAIQLFKGNSENNRTTNFISAVRLLRVRYIDKPPETYDTLKIYSNIDFYMADIGISSRKYVQDKYVFRFGVPEDVPIGKVFSLTGGYQIKNCTGRLYLGARVSFGNFYKWGHLSSNFEYGTYFRSSQAEQGVFNAGVNYFTVLFEIGKWKFRQFVKTHITIGIDRFPNENLSINDGNGIDGFNSTDLTGTNRLVFTLQTQSYAPWNLIGFRFGPYLICSLGMLGDASTGFINSKVYSLIGIGVLVKNENLVLKTFQVSISFYPVIPGNGLDIFKTNSFKTTDFGYRDYVIGKPAIIGFQ